MCALHLAWQLAWLRSERLLPDDGAESALAKPRLWLQVDKLEGEINKVKDRIFKDFSKQAGVKNMREYEAQVEAKRAKAEEEASAMKRHLAELAAAEERASRAATDLAVKRERVEKSKQVRAGLVAPLQRR